MNFPAKGSLSDISFVEILKSAAQTEMTGMVRMERGITIKVVYISQGTIAFASSNEKTDRLTEVLKRAGKLTPEQIEDAQNRLKPNISLGKTLVELGYISPKDLLWGARAQVEAIVSDLLFWPEGGYQIMTGVLPKEIVSLGLQIPIVIFDGILKTQDRQWVLQHIGSPEAVYKLTPDFHERNAGMKLPVEAVVTRINGKRSLTDIAQSAGLDAFEVCKTAVALQVLDLVDSVKEEPLQMPLVEPIVPAANEEDEYAATQIVSRPDVSLGEVLQIPSVSDLQRDQPQYPGMDVQEEQNEESSTEPMVEEMVPEREEERPAYKESFYKPPPLPPDDSEAEPEPVAPTLITIAKPAASTTPAPVLEEEDKEEQEPAISFLESSSVKDLNDSMGGPLSFSARKKKRMQIDWKKTAILLIVFSGIALAGVFFYTKTRNTKPEFDLNAKQPAPLTRKVPKEKPSEEKEPVKPSPTVIPPVTTSPPPSVTPATPPEVKTTPPSEPDAVQLVRTGKLPEAAAIYNKSMNRQRSRYTIQLVLACQSKTVVEAFEKLSYSAAASFIPINYRGQACYRVLYGVYPTEAAAKAARATLPGAFLNQQSPAQVVLISKILR